MATRSSPTVWRRWLAGELRRLRDESGLSQKDVGKHCGWSGVKVSYLENGQQNPADDDLDQLLPLYDVAPGDRSPYYEAARCGREKGWWESYDDRDAPEYFKAYVGLEQGATRIRAVEPFIVPGLLQTRDYIDEVLRHDPDRPVDSQVERIADLRITRQRILTTEPPVELDVVIDESVLHRVVRDVGLMASQLTAIAAKAQLPHVTVRVFPFARGINQGVIGPYRILDLGLGLGPIVYMEYRKGANWLDDIKAVEDHIKIFNYLAAEALSPEDSVEFIESLVAGWRG